MPIKLANRIHGTNPDEQKRLEHKRFIMRQERLAQKIDKRRLELQNIEKSRNMKLTSFIL